MKKKLLVLFSFLALIQSLEAQVTPPCPNPPPPGAENCASTCVYCDFDGYTGTNAGTASGGALVCGQIGLHNDQWFGFVAGTESITIDLLTENCTAGDGLQSAFFDDCMNDALVCNAGSGGGAGVPLTLTYSGFVPGQTYYFMLDGYGGDVCDFEIDVTDGSITPPPPGAPTPPQGPLQVCPGATVVYSIPEVFGAGYYRWTAPAGAQINGGGNNVQVPAPEGATVTITFGSAGGQVCVKVGNACFPEQSACINVTNKPIPATQLSPITICNDDLPFTWDEEPHTYITNTGTYNLTSSPYNSYLGCDSTVKQTIVVKPQISTNIGLKYLCEGTCYVINGNQYCDPGFYQEIFQSYQGCDSVVQFSISVIPSMAVIADPPILTCANNAVVLNSAGSSSGPNVFYSWSNVNWQQIGTQATQSVTNGGVYHLVVTSVGGGTSCRDTAEVTVNSTVVPPGAVAQGGTLTCQANGSTVTLQGSSSTTGVNFSWTGPGITPANAFLQNPSVTVGGSYVLTVTNPATGCTSTATATVAVNNTPPVVSAVGDTILCSQPIALLNGSSDAAASAYTWTGPGINAANMNQEDPSVTLPGTYSVTVVNTANGCSSTATTVVLQDTATPTVSAGNDQIITCAQTSVTLAGSGSPANVTLLWTGPGINAGNQNQATPSINQPGTYILTVTNPVNGCFKRDTALIDVSLTPPSVDAGAAQTITCAVTSVVLGGNGSSQGANFQPTWTGPGINAGNANQFNPVVNLSGNYTLTILNTTNGCTSTGTVTVNLNVTTPVATAGQDQLLTCTTPNGITLSGGGSPAGITYLWTGPGIGANNETLQNPQVTQPGLYILEVTNPVNGCTATDQVQVQQDANVPMANAGPDLGLNCAVSVVNINASGSSGPSITYTWTGPGITPANANILSPTGLSTPGTYTLQVLDASNNCENTDVVVITIDTLRPTAIAGPDLILNCYNKGADTLNATASSTGANFTYQWNGAGITPGNAASATPVVSLAGTYTLTVTNTDNQCTTTDTAVVADDQVPPVAAAGVDKIIDCVVTTTLIGGASSSGANFTYLWTGPGINPGNAAAAQPTVAKAGTYSLVVTNTVNGCTATDDAVVTLNAVYPTAIAGPDLILTCATPAQILNGSSSSSGAGFQTLWTGPGINAGNANQLSPNITVPGTYILAITNTGNSCVTQDTAIVQENKVIPDASAGGDQGLDCQTTSVVLDGSGSSSGASIVYTWTGPGITPGNASQNSPSVTQPGSYTLLVTDNINGCTSTDAVDISQDIDQPVADAGQSITLTCALTELPIDGSGSSNGPLFQYVWQGPGINSSNFNLQSPPVKSPGTYTVIVTNIQNHCTATAQVVVNQNNTPPLTSAGVDKTLTCALDTLSLDGSGSLSGPGISYSWSGPGIVVGDEALISPRVYLPGAYTITVVNGNNGCTATDIVNVEQNTLPPIANAGSDQILTCATTNGIKISAAASNTGTGYSLLWSGPGINAGNQSLIEPVVTAPGTYTVVVTDLGNGCTNSDEVTVNQDQNLPVPNAGPNQTLNCAITQTTLDASASTGNGTLDFKWAGPGINALNQTDVKPVVNAPGIYTVTVSNVLTGCSATATVQVFLDNTPPQVNLTGGTITCTSLEVTLTATSSVPGSTFHWTGPDIDLSNENQQNPKVGEPGSYMVVVTAPNGCTAAAGVNVAIDSNVPVGKAEGTQLNCTNNGQSTITGEVITAGATFTWSGPGGFTSTVLTPTVTAPGTYIFTVISPNGCKKPYDVEVTSDFNIPSAGAHVGELLDCNTTSLTLSAPNTSTGPSFTYSWSTSGGNIVSGSNTLSPVVSAAGVYTLLVTNILNGCTNTADVLVENDPSVPTAFSLAVKNIRCFGETNGSILIESIAGGTQPFTYTLNGGAATGNPLFSKLGEGDYTIHLTDFNGCVLDTTVQITAPGALQVSLEEDVTVVLGEKVTVNATITGTTPVESITWSPLAPCLDQNCYGYDTIPQRSYQQRITVVDINGCVGTDIQNIRVDRKRRVFVPNVFNPESIEPLNSFFAIQGDIDVKLVKSWQIFDRWGNAVFSRTNFPIGDPSGFWDGKFRGDDAPVAVYVWYAEIEFIDGETELFSGDVTLLRN